MEKYIVMSYVVTYKQERDGYFGTTSIKGLFHSREDAEKFINDEFPEQKQRDEYGDYRLVLNYPLETHTSKKQVAMAGDALYIHLDERGFLDEKIES